MRGRAKAKKKLRGVNAMGNEKVIMGWKLLALLLFLALFGFVPASTLSSTKPVVITVEGKFNVMGPPVVRDREVFIFATKELKAIELPSRTTKLIKSLSNWPVEAIRGPNGILLYRTLDEVGAVGTNNQLLWEHKLKTGYTFGLQVFGDIVIVDGLTNIRYDFDSGEGFYDSSLIAINSFTGQILWRTMILQGQSSLLWGAIQYQDRLYIFASNGLVRALRAEDGKILGQWQLAFGLCNHPVLYKTSVLLASSGNLFSLSLDSLKPGETTPITGAELWKGNEPSIFVGNSPLVVGEVAYFGTSYGRYNADIDSPDANPNRPMGNKNYVYALNLETGRLQWQVEVPGTERGISDIDYSPVDINGHLYVTSRHGLVLKIDAHNGNIDWQLDVKQLDKRNFFAYPPVVVKEGLFLAANHGLYLLNENP